VENKFRLGLWITANCPQEILAINGHLVAEKQRRFFAGCGLKQGDAMKNLRCSYLLGGSVATLAFVCLSAPTRAQDTSASNTGVETVTVTGSLINIAGFQEPTPVTQVGATEIESAARINITDELATLPAVGASLSLDTGGNSAFFSQGSAALSEVNLRDLGVQRTLVLFDGQRVVSSNLNVGGVDLATIPTDLVSRVDVVTGGASAVYGSDAVAGVVNLILDKSFTGIKASLEGSDTTGFEHREIKAAMSWGTDFDGDRGHLILSGDHTWSPDPVFVTEPNWYTNAAIVQNPAATSTNGLPYYKAVRNTGNDLYVQQGIISANTAGGFGSTITANSLKGTTFGSAGSPAPFDYGTVNANNNLVCYNGCTSNAFNTYNLNDNLLAIPYHNSTIFAYASYKLTPDIQASIQLNYGLLSEENTGGNRASNVVIADDNAYIPQSIASQFGTLSNGYNAATGAGGTAARPTQTITVGSNNTNNYVPGSPMNLQQLCSDTVGVPCLRLDRDLKRGVFTLQGSVFGDWTWNAYVEDSDMRQHEVAANDPFAPNYNNAIDAVTVTTANVGSSGLPLGSIQCRVALTTANTGCQPLDIFGTDVASKAAIDYVNPGQNPNSGILNQETIIMNQAVLHAEMQGELPWGLPAGNIAVAFGGEYRHEQGGQFHADPYGAVSDWSAGNMNAFSGQYTTREGFLEADVPILKDQYVESLSVNMAGRVTDYSTSGVVETWKLGTVSQINDDFRLRGTWSLDIRAPSITELFSTNNIGIGQYSYPTNTPTYTASSGTGGNPNLQPEKAITESGGVVFTPHWIDGLSLSVDWYNINVHNYIYTTGGQEEITRCLAGQTLYCSYLEFSPTLNNGTQPYLINSYPENAATLRTSGMDIVGNYSTPFYNGSLLWTLRANYNDEMTETAIGATYDQAGSLGAASLAYQYNTTPKWRGTLAATYDEGPWAFTVQGRFLGAAVLTNGVEGLNPNVVTFASLSSAGVLTAGAGNGNLLDNNIQNPVAYLDLRSSYQWSPRISLFAAVDNVTDVPRPLFGANNVYDPLGRVIRVGVRFSN
jgi:outer membrane receptor protein involved in Fe transport